MWRTARGRSGVNSTLITVVSAFLSLLIASPSSAVAAKVAHSRIKSAAPKPAAPAGKQTATGIFNPGREMLLRLQEGQRTLEKQIPELNAGIQTRIRQLSGEIEDSEGKTREMLEQTALRIDSTQRLLKLIAEAYRCVTGTLVGWTFLHCATASEAPREIGRVEGQSSGVGSRRSNCQLAER